MIENRFTELLSAAQLTHRMKVVLQACLLGPQQNTNEDKVTFFPGQAEERCSVMPKGIGSVFAGMEKRFDTANIWEIEYTSVTLNPNRKKTTYVLYVSNEIVTDAIEWAQNWVAEDEPEEKKVPGKRGRPRKVENTPQSAE